MYEQAISPGKDEITCYENNNSMDDFIVQRSWVRYPVWQYTFVSPSAFSRRAVVSY